MITVKKFLPEHYLKIREQRSQLHLGPFMTEAHLQAMAASPWSFTGVWHDRIVACGGVIPYWEGRGEAWASIDREVKEAFIGIHRAALKMLEECTVRRIEASVDRGFKEGHRWVGLLGFE